MQTVKVFSMNDCDWMAAATLDEAKTAYHAVSDDNSCENPHELDDAAMGRLIFTDDDGTRRTFKEQLEREVAEGKQFPAFFASTEF